MVATQTDDPWVRPFVRRGARRVVQHLAVSLLHLLEGMRCVEGCDWDIATVDDVELFCEGVNAPDGVVATSFLFARGAGADTAGPEACAGAVGGARVVWEAEDGNIERLWRRD